MINFKVVGFIIGVLLIIEGTCIALSGGISFIYGDTDALHIMLAAIITLLAGGLLWALFYASDKSIGKREGYIIVSSGWIFFSVFGAIPFILSDYGVDNYTDAFFETMSGFTTTGASILEDYDPSSNMFLMSHGLLFWRSMTQWLGGMGIIVLSLVILPILGIGGMQLFAAEVPGPSPDKLHPRIKETAKRLWGIYIIYTLAETVLLWLGEMNLFDAVCHSFTTMATGGYSTRQASIEFYQLPYTHYVISFFMFLAGVNFTLSYFALHSKFKTVWKNEEFRFYISFLAILTVAITFILYFDQYAHLEESFRNALFQVVSIMTTTGYATYNYLDWLPAAVMLLFIAMFIGGSSGSTGGSIKVIRITLLIKNGFLELKRLLHPNAIIPVRIDKQAVRPEIVTNVLAFVSVYLLTFLSGVIVISVLGHDFNTSLGSVAATLGNIGPGIGNVGPACNYADFSVFGKWFLSFLMLVGRLELFTVFILLSPDFWKK